MKTKIYFIVFFSSLVMGFASAQHNIAVHISEIAKENKPHIRITITNNNDDFILLISSGPTDDIGMPVWNCKTYYSFRALPENPTDTTILFKSGRLGFLHPSKAKTIGPHIVLKKGQSFVYDAQLYKSYFFIGSIHSNKQHLFKRIQCVIETTSIYNNQNYNGIYTSNIIELSDWDKKLNKNKYLDTIN